MRLLWVFSTFAIGGPQRRAATLMEKLGSEHVVAALDGRWEAEAFVGAGVNWRKAPLDWRKTSLVSLRNLAFVRRTLKDVAPDLLLTSNWGAIEWAIANRGPGATPHIHFEDGFGPDESPAQQNSKRILARWLFLNDRAVVVPSATLRDVALSRWKLPAANVYFIPNGIDVERFAREPKQSGGPVFVGSIGALRGEKNYPRLVRAVSAVNAEIRLKIWGEGDQRAAIEREAARVGFKGLFLPGITRAPEEALTELDIFALSSDTEQMPLSLIEAMAAGLPAAATDVGDIATMVSAENRAFITPAGDDAALAAAIARLAGDPPLRARLGAANRAKARAEFATEKMAAAYAELFQRATAGRRDR